jgi:hypothetical protein
MVRSGLSLIAAATAVLVASVLGASPSSGATPPLPPGCNLQYGGQSLYTLGGHTMRFTFQGFNAVAPTHRVKDARISWGDGKTTSATSKRRSTPFVKNCYVTNFSARHTYPAITSCKVPVAICSKAYNVTIRYRDTKTNARHTLHKLRVVIGPTLKKK